MPVATIGGQTADAPATLSGHDDWPRFRGSEDWPPLTSNDDRPSTASLDEWPHTRRPLPWILAAFLVMVFLVPFDSIKFKLHLPANASPDRVLLALMFAAIVLRAITQGATKRFRRMSPVERAVLIFGAIALLSLVLNVDRIYQENQLTFVEKAFSQLIAYGAFFFIVIRAMRPTEISAFAKLIMILTCLTALGTLYEAHSGYNVFYVWSAKLLGPLASVPPAPTAIHPLFGKAIIVGPTQHGLALASMLTIGLPFAVLPLLEPQRISRRLLYLVLIGLILGADLSTSEKTAIFAPIAAFGVLLAYKRQLRRWALVAIIPLIPVVHVAAPGALGSVATILPISSGTSTDEPDYTDGRASDYPAVAPDLLNNLWIGRGYGSLDTANWRWYRILDNQYLGLLFVVGFVGLIAFLVVVAAPLMTAHRIIKAGGERAPPVLAAAAGCAAFALVSATYDSMGFAQAPYTFLFVAALVAVAARERYERQSAIRAAAADRATPSAPHTGDHELDRSAFA